MSADGGDPSELLHRQVHPSFVQAGRVSSAAFTPTRKDAGKLSVDRGSLTTAREAFERYRREDRRSAGVWSISRRECEVQRLDVIPEPVEGEMPNPAHAFVDFHDLTGGETRRRGQLLARAANERGIQHSESLGHGE